MVQWNHRALGTSTAVSALTLTGIGLFHPAARGALTPQVTKGLTLLGGVAFGQMSLGIVTLLNYVPVGLAAAHQLGSLVVLSSGIYVVHSLRYVSPAVLKQISSRSAAEIAPKLGGASGGFGVASKAMKSMV